MIYTFVCEKCEKTFTKEIDELDYEKDKKRKKKKYNYRFCCKSCANSRITTEEKREKIKNGLIEYNKENETILYEYICEKCGKVFKHKKIRNGRHIHCDDCKQKRPHIKEKTDSLLDLSKRTVCKILKRAKQKCAICGWDESTCDVHHIVEKKNGGTDNIDNLIIVCPNCHRVIHSNKKYSIEFLNSLSIEKTFKNWKDFYHPSN